MPPSRSCSIELSNASWLKASSTSTDVAARAQALFAEADLIEAVAALDLGGRDGVGQDVIAGAGGGLSDHLAGDEDAFAGFTGDANDEVFACHGTEPPPEVGLGRIRSARCSGRRRVPNDSPTSDAAEWVPAAE